MTNYEYQMTQQNSSLFLTKNKNSPEAHEREQNIQKKIKR